MGVVADTWLHCSLCTAQPQAAALEWRRFVLIDQASSDDHMVTHGSFSTNVVGVLAKRGLVFFV
jgi:hypothetical protein